MRCRFIASLVIVLAWASALAPASFAQDATGETNESSHPSTTSKIPDGLLKNEALREKLERVEEIFEAMGVGPGSWVADIGAGDGFFAIRLAKRVGVAGRVFAVDIKERPLAIISERAKQENLENIRTILTKPYDPELPPRAFDAILVSNTYHEIEDYPAVLQVLASALKANGRLVIVDRVQQEPAPLPSRAEQTAQHEIHPDYVTKELADAEFEVQRTEQSFVRTVHGQWLIVAVPSSR